MEEQLTPAPQLLGAGLPAGLWMEHGWQRAGRRVAVPLLGALLLAGGLALTVRPARLAGAEPAPLPAPPSAPLIRQLASGLAHQGAAIGSAVAATARALEEGAKPPAAPAEPKSLRELGRGEASWYAGGFEGRPTASGELYRAAAMTAAHRTLPFGSLLRVTNLRNGRSVVVRVNDRGPFHARRIVDLSRAAAAEIGMMRRGRAKVRLELLAATR
ncbi:MAG TPA: septal ring lytic transglycosylase RlpA family protein [Thermoanaerobaculia bacterium]|jgi:rare lipoprotein A|nr:septal ring lytic transglycosylase RlpA family protein [Thermoanaerobaculia bacterium]